MSLKNIFLPIIILIALNSYSQIVFIDSVNVSGTSSIQKQTQTGRNILSLNGKLFEKFAINSVDELLRYVGGVEVQQRGPQGSQSDILIRGGTYQQVLILLDGIRLNDPLTGHFNGNIPIHPNEIERVEILKGASSAVWGSDAVGGIIHIITKGFSLNNTNGYKVNLGIQLGEYNLNNYNLHFSKQTKNIYWSLGALSNNAKGIQLRGTTSKFNNNILHGAFQYKLKNNWRLSFKSILDSRDFNAQNFYTPFKSDTAAEKVNSFFNHLQIAKKWYNGSFTSDLSYKLLNDNFQYNASSKANENKTSQLIYQLNYQSKLNKTTNYINGLQFINKSIMSNDRGNHNLMNGAIWLILKHQLKSHLFLNESIRANWNENYGVIFSPQLNITYNPNKWSFRTSIARGIRDADFTERYNNYNKTLVTGGSIGNPNLKTENTINFELGADYVKNNNLKVSTTAFYRNQNNLIDWTPTAYADMPRQSNLSSTGVYALARNVEEVKTYGAELDINFIKKINTNNTFIIYYNLTKLYTKNSDSIPSFYISGSAKLISTLSFIYNYKTINIAINGLYKVRNTQQASAINANISKDYFLLNTKLSYNLKKYNSNIFAQIHNVLNQKYSDILGSVMPRRWLSGGLNFNF